MNEVKKPSRSWVVHVCRARRITDCRIIVVEAEGPDAALAAAMASRDRLDDGSDEWEYPEEKVVSFDGEADAEAIDAEPQYRVGADGRLEEVARTVGIHHPTASSIDFSRWPTGAS
jgi:hypothetical protein